MEKVEKNLLSHCVRALVDVQLKLRETTADRLIQGTRSGKDDSLYLDVLPENILQLNLLQDYDKHIVLVTEERGKFNYEIISEAETVVFSDPTDRSKQLKSFIEQAVDRDLVRRNSLFGDLLSVQNAASLWEEVGGRPARLTGACCSVTVVKRGEILFTVILNYITEEIFLACKDRFGWQPLAAIRDSESAHNFSTWARFKFPRPAGDRERSYATYLGKRYPEYLEKTQLLDETFRSVEGEPGGPLRILYLSDLHPEPPGFILSNGEKVGEWIGWLAFCRYSEDLVAYSVYPDTFFAKDDILMTPSPLYSILEVGKGTLRLNYEKLKHFENPSRYREMILVTHRNNGSIRARIEATKSRILFLG